MADLISRKALLEELDKWINPCVNYDKSEFLSGIATAISEVEAAHAVDAAPVVHGRWIKKKNPQWPAYSHDCCSVCGWWNTKNALSYDGNRKPGHSLNYCPNCGAKMDGGNDND